MSFKGDLSPVEKLYAIIEKVIIVKGVIPTDPTVWEFHIDRKILRVDTDSLENQTSFRRQYMKAFDVPAPKIKADDWLNMLQALSSEKAERVKGSEESIRVFVANQVFELICDREITDDPDEAATQELLFQYEKDDKQYLAMTSATIKKIVDSTGYKVQMNNLSEDMSELGFKREGTYPVRYNGPQLRSWLFIPKAVSKYKGE